MIKTLSTMLVIAAACSACTWVKLNDDARTVRLVRPGDVAGCERIGEATAHTLNKMAFMKRSRDKQNEELSTLARNEAADMGGDAVVATSDLSEGSRKYAVYRCQ